MTAWETGSSGYIAEPGPEVYRHRFGGASWDMDPPDDGGGELILLLSLDLSDPKLSSLATKGFDELPLCAYGNSISLGGEVYRPDPATHHVHLVTAPKVLEPMQPDDWLPNPLPERPIHLRPMTVEELGRTEDDYWRARDGFIGGSPFLRVLGPVLWLQEPQPTACGCGKGMQYVASIGYESPEESGRFLPNDWFMLGDMALYHFWCGSCGLMQVVMQGT